MIAKDVTVDDVPRPAATQYKHLKQLPVTLLSGFLVINFPDKIYSY